MFVLMSSRICLKLGHLGSKTRSPGQILLKMFVLMSSRICSKLGHLVSTTTVGHRAKSAENFVIIILNFDLNVCLDQF